jgi:hypothetical protein
MCHIDLIAAVVILNVTLSALHALLERFYLKTENKVDDRLYKVTGYLLTMLEWMMAARRGKR